MKEQAKAACEQALRIIETFKHANKKPISIGMLHTRLKEYQAKFPSIHPSEVIAMLVRNGSIGLDKYTFVKEVKPK